MWIAVVKMKGMIVGKGAEVMASRGVTGKGGKSSIIVVMVAPRGV